MKNNTATENEFNQAIEACEGIDNLRLRGFALNEIKQYRYNLEKARELDF